MSALRRVSWGRWLFIALQLIFILWLVTGIASTSHHATGCEQLSQHTCDSAYNAGRAIGAFLIVFLWVAVDVIIGVCVFIVRRTRRAS